MDESELRRVLASHGHASTGAEDSTGQPIQPGNRVRYNGTVYRVEQTLIPGDPYQCVKLEGLVEPVSETSVDLVTRSSE